MKRKAKFIRWLILASVIVPIGFYGGWSLFDCIALGFLLLYGVVLAVSMFGHRPLMRRIAAMSDVERERFMAQFTEEERQRLTAKLKDHLDRQKTA